MSDHTDGQAMQALRTSLTGPSFAEASFTLAAARAEIWRLRGRLKAQLGPQAFSDREDSAWEQLHTRIVETIDWCAKKAEEHE